MEDDSIDLGRLFSRIVGQWRVGVLVVIAVLIGSFVYAFVAKEYYKVSTKIIYQSSAKTSGNLAALASLAGLSASTASDDASSYLMDVIYSADVLTLVIEKEWPINSNRDKNGKKVSLEQLWGVEIERECENWKLRRNETLLNLLVTKKYINYSQDKKSGVITLTTEFEDPRVAYDVNVFLFQELNNTLVHKMNFKASANRKFIEGRLSEVKDDLRRSENNLRNYRERNRLRLDPGDVLEDSRLQREVLINQEVMIQLQKQYEMAKIEEAKDLPVLDIIDSPRMPVEKSKPQRKKIVLIGLFAGIFLGMLAALGYDLWLEKRRIQVA